MRSGVQDELAIKPPAGTCSFAISTSSLRLICEVSGLTLGNRSNRHRRAGRTDESVRLAMPIWRLLRYQFKASNVS